MTPVTIRQSQSDSCQLRIPSSTICATRWPQSKGAPRCSSARHSLKRTSSGSLGIYILRFRPHARIAGGTLRSEATSGKGTQTFRCMREVASAVDEIVARAEAQSVHIIRVVPEQLSIVLDPRRIHRVLVNLLVNALDAMPQGRRILISAARDGRSVLIRVRDSGPGVASEIADRLFQPFTTVGKTESSLQGACFVVQLPMIAEPHKVCFAK